MGWASVAVAQEDPYALRAGAWDRSLELERAGEVAAARDLLMRAWGPDSDSYEVMVRLAYLENKLGHTGTSLSLYRRAKSMPGADRDASNGLAWALTDEGYSRLNSGDRGGARDSFEEAIALDSSATQAREGLELLGPESRVDPEIWAAYVNQSVEPDRFQGWALFAHVPWRLSDHVKLRLAGRYIETYQDTFTGPPAPPPPPPPAGGAMGSGRQGASSSKTTDRQGELYASLEWSARYVAIEGMGLAIVRKGEGLVPGEAASLRLGGQAGLLVQQALFARKLGTGWQALPQLYWWPTPSFGMAAGARYTHDPRGSDVSAVAGLSLVGNGAALYLQGHAGTERWPMSIETPAVLALDSDLTLGLTATTTFRLGDSLQLGLQGQWERVKVPAYEGSYFSASTGLIWSP